MLYFYHVVEKPTMYIFCFFTISAKKKIYEIRKIYKKNHTHTPPNSTDMTKLRRCLIQYTFYLMTVLLTQRLSSYITIIKKRSIVRIIRLKFTTT